MKKIFTGLLVCFLTVFMTVSSVNALDISKVDEAYEKVVEFYKTQKVLESPDEIIAVEALGLEAESGYQLPDFESINFKKATIGDLTKSIIALVLIEKNPTDIDGQNLVEILEGYVQEDGSVKSGEYEADAGYLAWVYYALETVGSEKANDVVKYLATTDNTNVNYGDGGFTSYGYSNPDVTGWCIEALELSGNYSSRVEEAIGYLRAQLKEDASFGSYGANADTQACVLQGLFVHDIDSVLDGNFNAGDINPIDVLLLFQLEDGSFKSEVYDENWYPTGEYKFNSYATMEAARCLGTYKNGSVISKAKATYQEIVNNVEDEPTNEPEEEQNPSVDVEEAVSENPVTIENSQQTTEKDEPTTTTENAKIVETSDSNDLTGFAIMTVVSGGLFIALRKKDEEIC